MYVCMYQCVPLGHTQLLLYESVVVAVVAAMDFTRTHTSTVVVVVAAVDITRKYIFVVVVTVEMYTRSAGVLCTI